MTVFDYELKIHPKYLVANIKKHVETAVCNLKYQEIFNNTQCINIIKNVDLKCIQVTNGNSDHIAYLTMKSDQINLKAGKTYTGQITHIIWNKTLVIKIKNQITVFVNFNPDDNVNDIVKVKITQIDDISKKCNGDLKK